ncbi:hypothetical protein, partial [Caballeronia sp. M23-90]
MSGTFTSCDPPPAGFCPAGLDAAGTVKEVKVKIGDNVSEGSLILTLEGQGGGVSQVEEKPQ